MTSLICSEPQALIGTLEFLEQNILGLFENLLVSLTEKVLAPSVGNWIDRQREARSQSGLP